MTSVGQAYVEILDTAETPRPSQSSSSRGRQIQLIAVNKERNFDEPTAVVVVVTSSCRFIPGPRQGACDGRRRHRVALLASLFDTKNLSLFLSLENTTVKGHSIIPWAYYTADGVSVIHKGLLC